MNKSNVHFVVTKKIQLRNNPSLSNLSSDQQDDRLWDSFQDPPSPLFSGSAHGSQRFHQLKQALKLFTYIFVFIVILSSAVTSKLLIIFMSIFSRHKYQSNYCIHGKIRLILLLFVCFLFKRNGQKIEKYKNKSSKMFTDQNEKAIAEFNDDFQVAIIWMLCISFSMPEVFSFLRAARICFYRKNRFFTCIEFISVKGQHRTCVRTFVWTLSVCFLLHFQIASIEVLNVIGLAILFFIILPNVSLVESLLIINSVHLSPSILSECCLPKKKITIFRFSLNDDELSFAIDFFSRSSNELKKWQSTIVDVACILIEFMIIFIWPIYYSGSFQSWMISIALILISLGWWENFVSMHSKFRKLNCVFVCFSWQFAIAMLFVGFLFSNNSTFGNVQ